MQQPDNVSNTTVRQITEHDACGGTGRMRTLDVVEMFGLLTAADMQEMDRLITLCSAHLCMTDTVEKS